MPGSTSGQLNSYHYEQQYSVGSVILNANKRYWVATDEKDIDNQTAEMPKMFESLKKA